MAAIKQMYQTNDITNGGARVPYLLMFLSDGSFAGSAFPDPPIGIPNAGSPVNPGAAASMCQRNGVVIIAAGSDLYSTNFNFFGAGTQTVVDLVASVGSLPPSPDLVCFYQDRLVASDRRNLYFSATGDETDWDYTLPGAGSAIAGNTLNGGVLGDIHLALMPMSNDALYIGMSKSLARLTGNPGAGGQLEIISRNIGVFGMDAWTQDPQGNIWFAGPQGFWKLSAGGGLENMSEMKLAKFFQRIPRLDYDVQCRWDAVLQGCYIFVTRKASGTSTHIWYDARTKGFFKWRFPIAHGPVSSIVFDGNLPEEYVLLLGGRDGNVRKLDDSVLNDDGEAIMSYFFIGPFELAGPLKRAIVRQLHATLGENYTSLDGTFTLTDDDWNLQMAIWSADDAWRAYDDPTQIKDFVAYTKSGKQDAQGSAIGGNTFWLRGFNNTLDKTWIADRFVPNVRIGGREDGKIDP